jgi:hypothetical protein
MMRRNFVRLLIVFGLATLPATAYASGDCVSYCQGFAAGWCKAHQPGTTANYQGYLGTWGGSPDCRDNCLFGCDPPSD